MGEMKTVEQLLAARARYHRIRTAPAVTLLKRRHPAKFDHKQRVNNSVRAAERAVRRIETLMVYEYAARRTPPPAPADEIRIGFTLDEAGNPVGGQIYCLTHSANGTHRYVPQQDFIPSAKRIVPTDFIARSLAELHTTLEVTRREWLDGTEPEEEIEIA
jgi:hypothetical protein